MLVPNWLWF